MSMQQPVLAQHRGKVPSGSRLALTLGECYSLAIASTLHQRSRTKCITLKTDLAQKQADSHAAAMPSVELTFD